MDPTEKRALSRTALSLTAMGLGTAPIGNQFRFVSEDDARAVIKGAWDAGLRYFDTAPMYGHGLSEHRCGEALRWYPRDDYVLSTKVGRLLRPVPRTELEVTIWVDPPSFNIVHDYGYDATMRSVEDSLQRMALERIDILFIHDIDHYSHTPELQRQYFRSAMDGGYKALDALRSQGVVSAIGVGCNEWQVCEAALRERDFDCFLLAGRYTLLEQDALDTFLPLCTERDVSIILGGGYNSGILATGAVPGATYNYSEASEDVLEKVRRIEAVCRTYAVPLKAAALQFVLAHPMVRTNIPGTRTSAHLEENLAVFRHPIPSEFWAELKQCNLVREDAPVPA